MGRKTIHSLLDKMNSAEQKFLDAEFLAPVLQGGQVRVRIEGFVLMLRVVGRVEPGWAILKPVSLEKAEVIARPGLKQVRDYLSLFPALRLLLLAPEKSGWLAISAQAGHRRLKVEGPVTVYLAMGVEPFQQVIARYDGARFWFQEPDRRRNPAVAAYLREALAADTPPDQVRKPTLTAEEREAYRLVFQAAEEARRSRTEIRLTDALIHAGAELGSYIEREDSYTVSFEVDGRTHRAAVRKDDLTVLSAGICLSGQDRRFDLQSLVGVIREGRQEGRLVPVGDDGSEEEDPY